MAALSAKQMLWAIMFDSPGRLLSGGKMGIADILGLEPARQL